MSFSVDIEPLLLYSYDQLTLVDQNGTYLMVNQATVDSLGLPKETLIGMNARELLKLGVVDTCPSLTALAEKRVVMETIHVGGKPYFCTSVPIFDKKGTVSMVLTNARSGEVMESFYRRLEAEREQNSRYQEIINYVFTQRQHPLIYRSRAMGQIVAKSASIAKSDSTVLLTGASGSGKEVLARFIHNISSRKSQAFIPVNCSAIPSELFESEFFGYEAGAFTGANRKGKSGLLQMADQGTLFLDEVGELTPPMQSKLLRVLETGDFYPVGSERPRQVDVRVISATNRNLIKMVKNHTFREDLYYRLNIIPLKIPPLCERIEDIEVLADHFIHTFNKKHGKHFVLQPEQLQQMLDYAWPGNVRELRNTIERMVLLQSYASLGGPPELELTPDTAVRQKQEPHSNAGLPAVPLDRTLQEALQEFESQYIQAVIKKFDGRLSAAAKSLGIHRTTLYRKLQSRKGD